MCPDADGNPDKRAGNAKTCATRFEIDTPCKNAVKINYATAKLSFFSCAKFSNDFFPCKHINFDGERSLAKLSKSSRPLPPSEMC